MTSDTKSNDEEQECINEREYTLIRNGSDTSKLNFSLLMCGSRGGTGSPKSKQLFFLPTMCKCKFDKIDPLIQKIECKIG